MNKGNCHTQLQLSWWTELALFSLNQANTTERIRSSLFNIVFTTSEDISCVQVRCYPVQEAEVRVWAAQGQPEDHLQGELQV